MGGKIEVESEKNKGSTFSFSIWTGISKEDENTLTQTEDMRPSLTLSSSADEEEGEIDSVRIYGTAENLENLNRNLSKLILCVEMENWEKAEMFMETIRQLTEGAPREVSRAILRLKMAIQKENYEKASAGFEELNKLITC